MSQQHSVQTLLSLAPFLEGLDDSDGDSVTGFLAEQLRKGLLRLHCFHQTKQALFLGKDKKLYMACQTKLNDETGENQTKLNEIFYNKQAWQLTGTRKPDAAAVTITGTQQEAFLLNHLLELFSVAQSGSVMTRLLPEKKVIQVACSEGHCLALTTEGRVFSCGSSNGHGQLGLGNTNPSAQFQAVQLKMDSGTFRFASFVACGAFHSIVICEQESMYAFGWNNCLRLGITAEGSYSSPVRVGCPEQIKKACCGRAHSLFLSASGTVFGSGHGEKCQLGRNLRNNHPLSAITLPPAVAGRVVDIFAVPHADVSVLMNEQGALYICGAAGDLFGHSSYIEDFFPLKDRSVLTVVARERPLYGQPEIQGYQARFNDPSCCDIQVCAADEPEPIHFGWDTIRARSPYLTNMIASEMKEVSKLEDGKRKVTLQNYSRKTHYAYGKFIHESVLDAEPQTLLELLQLADEYNDETGLASLCASTLLRSITSDNLCGCLEHCLDMSFHMLASDLVKQGLVLSNVCDVLNVVARAQERAATASVKDEMADEIVAYIKEIIMAFAAQHATAVIEDAKFAAVIPWIAKDVLVKLGELKLLKT